MCKNIISFTVFIILYIKDVKRLTELKKRYTEKATKKRVAKKKKYERQIKKDKGIILE